MEMYTSESPYSFSGNNPVNNVDPSGMNYYTSMCKTHSDGGFMYRGSYTRCGNGGGGSSYGSSNVGRINPGYNGPGPSGDDFREYYSQYGGTNTTFKEWYEAGGRYGINVDIKDWYENSGDNGTYVKTSTNYILETKSHESFGWGVSLATSYLLALEIDLLTPEPSDAAWPKWVVHAVLGSVSAVIVYTTVDDINDSYNTSRGNPDNWSNDPVIRRFENDKFVQPGSNPPNWFKIFGIGYVTYEVYKNWPNPRIPKVSKFPRIEEVYQTPPENYYNP